MCRVRDSERYWRPWKTPNWKDGSPPVRTHWSWPGLSIILIMAAARKNNIPPDKLELYDKLIATNPEIQRKGAANPYTSLNGHMFTYLHQSRLAIRLPEGKREDF